MKIAAQILGNRFVALAREGALGFASMSRAPLVIEEGQYACAILDADGQLIAQDQGEPSQLAAVQASVAHALDAFAFNLSEGDVIVSGDPYCGGSWGGVLTVMVPLFFDGDLQFVTALRFAAADLAGAIPGPFQPEAHEIWQEALRITPVKLVRAGAAQKDVRQYLIRNTRATALLDSDLTTAEVTATRIAEQLGRMIALKGLGPVQDAARQRIAYGAVLAQAALAKLPEGSASAGPIRLALRRAERLTVDLHGTKDAAEDARNMTLQTSRAVVLTQLLGEVIEDAGLSQGLLDAVALSAPEGSVAHARFPAALSLGWRDTAPFLAQALAEAAGQRPVIAPAPPVVMLFPEIGSGPVTQPMLLSPGFSPCTGCAGGDAASGRRRILSVEEAEMAGLVALTRRTTGADGIEVALEITGSGLECINLPGGGQTVLEGATQRPRSDVMNLPKGARLRFTYPLREGGHDAEI